MTNVDEKVQEQEKVDIVQLKKPIVLDGKEITEIKLDFSNMTGADVLNVDKELREEGHSFGFDSVWNQKVLVKLAARASKMLAEDLTKLHAADFLELQFRTRNFFVQW